MRKFTKTMALATGALLAGSVALSTVSADAVACHPTYALKTAKHCKTGYTKETLRHEVKVRVKVHGRWETKKVSQRYVGCVWVMPATTTAPVTSLPQPVATPVVTNPGVVSAPAPTTTTQAPVVTTTTQPAPTTTTIPPLPKPTINMLSYGTSTTGLNGMLLPNPLVLQEQPYYGPGGGESDLGAGLDLWMNATGTVAGDVTPTGVLDFSISPSPWEQLAIWDNPAGTAGPQDCSNVVNTPTISDPPSPPGANSGCAIYFSEPGTYTITVSFVSSDANYESVTGPTYTVDVVAGT